LLDEAQDAMIALDLVVFVRASLRTIRDRLSKRDPPVSRLERGLGVDDRPFLRAEANSDAVIRKLEGCGVSIVEVANDIPAEMTRSARVVASTICSMLHGGEVSSSYGHQIGPERMAWR
jgi:hypothetical protein